jgi:hypothetical protein
MEGLSADAAKLILLNQGALLAQSLSAIQPEQIPEMMLMDKSRRSRYSE